MKNSAKNFYAINLVTAEIAWMSNTLICINLAMH